MRIMRLLFLSFVFIAFLAGIASAAPDTNDGVDIIDYYGTGCPHCARVEAVLEELKSGYDLSLVKKETYFDAANRQEMLNLYIRFGKDPNEGGVPTLLLENRSLIIGEVSKERMKEIIDDHITNATLSGVFTQSSFSPIEERDVSSQLTLVTLIGAAIVDSINPCTITVMVLLLGTILMSGGRKRMLLAAGVFIGVVFVSYLLMGLGIHYLIAGSEMTDIFYKVVTAAAFLLSVMEFNAYFNYKPGFFAVEMPVFLRPTLKGAFKKLKDAAGNDEQKTESLSKTLVVLLVTAGIALLCSIFLLPCSSGPYLMVLSMLSKTVTLKALMYLILYNMVFVLPMVIIAVVIYIGKTSVEEIGEMKEKYIRQIHLISGLILFVLFLLMLSQILASSA
ncbi:hypothetical protein H0O02_05090 [Candidatus Micrarchaeota archaeon]|nr:hypothetical protein [Candidatus Micrarchaeota archaeon]